MWRRVAPIPQKSQLENKQICSFAIVLNLFGLTEPGVVEGRPGPLPELMGDSVLKRLALRRAITVLFTIGFQHSLWYWIQLISFSVMADKETRSSLYFVSPKVTLSWQQYFRSSIITGLQTKVLFWSHPHYKSHTDVFYPPTSENKTMNIIYDKIKINSESLIYFFL